MQFTHDFTRKIWLTAALLALLPAAAHADGLADLKAQLDELQLWFARKPYGWRERATPGQLQQWEDRSREQDRIVEALERLG